MDNLDQENKQVLVNQDNLVPNGDEVAKIERYKQQIEGSKQEALKLREERISDWAERLTEDANSLELLEKKDLKIALEVAKKLGYSSIEEMKNENGLIKKEESQTGLSKDQFEKWYEERKAKDIHSIAINESMKIFNDLDESEKEIAKSKFEKLTKGQTLSMDDAKELADMTYLFITKDKIVKKDNKGVINLASTGLGNSKGQIKSSDPLIDTILKDW